MLPFSARGMHRPARAAIQYHFEKVLQAVKKFTPIIGYGMPGCKTPIFSSRERSLKHVERVRMRETEHGHFSANRLTDHFPDHAQTSLDLIEEFLPPVPSGGRLLALHLLELFPGTVDGKVLFI